MYKKKEVISGLMVLKYARLNKKCRQLLNKKNNYRNPRNFRQKNQLDNFLKILNNGKILYKHKFIF